MGGTLILAGDVGGTKTHLAFFDPSERGFQPLAEQRYSTTGYEDLAPLLHSFCRQSGYRPGCVVLGVPGSVRQTPVKPVNLPWIIDPAALRRALGAREVHLLNDLQATAYGVLTLEAGDVVVLNAGRADLQGNIAVIAAGTGLGEGGLCWTGRRYVAVASEGGHADFSPSSKVETELWLYLHEKFGHVSWERVLSGPGLANIYDFLRDSDRGREPAWLRAQLEASEDRAGLIARVAAEQRCELAAQALDLFVSLYGAEAGNLALKFLSTGGCYIGGGIAPRIIARLREEHFMNAFAAKGRMAPELEKIPVRIILSDKTACWGAAHWGAHLCGGS